MDKDTIRFEDIDPNDMEARLEAAKKEFEPLFAYTKESLKKKLSDIEEGDKVEKELSDAYQGHVLRGFDATSRAGEIVMMNDKVVENAGRAARMARKESDDLNQNYGKYVKK